MRVVQTVSCNAICTSPPGCVVMEVPAAEAPNTGEEAASMWEKAMREFME